MATLRQYQADFAAKLPTGKQLPVWIWPGGQGQFNPNCILSGQNLSPFTHSQADGCLIAPDIYMVSGHDPGVWEKSPITLWNGSGKWVNRTIKKAVRCRVYATPSNTKQGPLPDAVVFLLDSPFPSEITPVKFLPDDWQTHIDLNGAGMYVWLVSNAKKAGVFSVKYIDRVEATGTDGGIIRRARFNQILTGPLAAYSFPIEGTESGSPSFFLTPTGPILLSIDAIGNAANSAGKYTERGCTAWTDPNAWASLNEACAALGTASRPQKADLAAIFNPPPPQITVSIDASIPAKGGVKVSTVFRDGIQYGTPFVEVTP